MRPNPAQPGGSNPRARWTDEEAHELRETLQERRKHERVSYQKLAEELGCCPETVRSLVNRRRYR